MKKLKKIVGKILGFSLCMFVCPGLPTLLLAICLDLSAGASNEIIAGQIIEYTIVVGILGVGTAIFYS